MRSEEWDGIVEELMEQTQHFEIAIADFIEELEGRAERIRKRVSKKKAVS